MSISPCNLSFKQRRGYIAFMSLISLGRFVWGDNRYSIVSFDPLCYLFSDCTKGSVNICIGDACEEQILQRYMYCIAYERVVMLYFNRSMIDLYYTLQVSI